MFYLTMRRQEEPDYLDKQACRGSSSLLDHEGMHKACGLSCSGLCCVKDHAAACRHLL